MKHTNEMVPMIAIQNIQKPLATNLIVEKGKCEIKRNIHQMFLFILSSGGELLEMRLLDSHLLDTFGSKSIARHKFFHLLESS